MSRRLPPVPARPVALLIAALALCAGTAAAAERGVVGDLPFLDGGAGSGELYDRHIRIDLSPRPGKRPFPMLLDTGAAEATMTPLYARALQVSVHRLRDDYYRKHTILGRDLLFRIDTSSSDTGSRSGMEVGLLGDNFLRHYVVEVDYDAGRVRFLDPKLHEVSEESAEPGELILPMGTTDGRPTVEIGLGSGSLDFVMDTGAPDCLMISQEKAGELGIEVPEHAEKQRGRNMLGTDVSQSFYVPSVALGSREVRHVVLNVTMREGSTYRATNLAGQDEALLGNRFLSRFRVRFDYPHGRVGLLPRVDPPPPEEVVPYLAAARAEGGSETRPGAVAGSDSAAGPGSEHMPIWVPVDLTPARAARTFEQEVWVDVDVDALGAHVQGPVSYFDLKGWAGAGQALEHDVVIVIDTSGSTAIASGSDVDGDGKIGRRSKRKREPWRNFNPGYLSSDSGDTILAAELLATRRLVERMGPGRTRIGIVSFSQEAGLEAPLGAKKEVLEEALDGLDARFGSGLTNMAQALSVATEALLVARPPEGERRQSILILSDGYPTLPEGEAEDRTYEAAREAAELGIRIYSFALGLGELEPDDVFAEMAMVSGGGHVRLEQPGDVVHELALVNLTDVTEVAIVNRTTGKNARATRMFPDGSFDALVPLEEGENVIEVTARGDAGGEASLERRILYHRPEPADAMEAEQFAAQLAAFREELKVRTLETALAQRAREGSEGDAELRRALEVEPEE